MLQASPGRIDQVKEKYKRNLYKGRESECDERLCYHNKHDNPAVADVVQCAESLLNEMKIGVIVCVA